MWYEAPTSNFPNLNPAPTEMSEPIPASSSPLPLSPPSTKEASRFPLA